MLNAVYLLIKRSVVLLILYIYFIPAAIAQDKIDPGLLVRFNVRAIDGYVFESEAGQDSFLITRDSINEKGRKTKVEVYDRHGIHCEYIYTFRDDTLCTKRVTRCNGDVISITDLYYDDQNREIKTIDYTDLTSRSGTYSLTQYNDKKRTKEVKIYFYNELSIEEITQYNQDHEPIKISKRRNGKWEHTRIENGLSSNIKVIELEDYNGTGLNLFRKIMTMDAEKTILGLNGPLKLVPGDILITEEYRNFKGLVEYECQYLNQKFIAKKKFKYICS